MRIKLSFSFLGDWFEIDNDFCCWAGRVTFLIPISDLEFPTVHNWTYEDKEKIESEGDYRASFNIKIIPFTWQEVG